MPNKFKSRPGQEHFVCDIDETGLGAVDAVQYSSAPSTMWGETWKQLRTRPIFWLSSTIILMVIILAMVPFLFTSADPHYCELSRSLAPATSQNWFGFDRQGCDIFARVVYGARASVMVGIFTTILVLLIGGVFGALAGYYGGFLDTLLSRLTDIFFAVPLVLAAIVVMQMFKESRSVWVVVSVLAAFGWPQIARITRGSVMSVRNREFITAARAAGQTKFKILLYHVLPNAIAPIIVYATVALGTFIVAEATLSFMGIGLPASIVSWGADIAKAQATLRVQPWVLFFPSIVLALTVLSFIMMGDAIRDALDPKTRNK